MRKDEMGQDAKELKQKVQRQYVNGERPLTNAERVRRYKQAKAVRAATDPAHSPPMIQMNIWIRPESREKLRAVARHHSMSMGKLVEALAETLFEEMVLERITTGPLSE
ncbi:hypothetical protein [Amantichitinum ursilacus]|uniref:Uncharacterized protein n=1 Tax=Amantichitinum ursilacus TaxID=857265 RepID=A0A0N1JS76_9NEIS|nr:hypothetical protein [Amantichitinum ursilacus]KPC52287.1 hypothetical protein WG78_14550 [Amantichitinum ursilacus]